MSVRARVGFTTSGVIRSTLDEISDHGEGAFRFIGDYGVPAIWKLLELNEMPKQHSCDISLALYQVYRIIFPTQH